MSQSHLSSPHPSSANDLVAGPYPSGAVRLDDVPFPKFTLFRRELVELGFRIPCGPGAGMYNLGNTCYMNSTLQALFHTPPFVNYLRYGGHVTEGKCPLQAGFSCTICILAATLRSTTEQDVIKPEKIYAELKIICKHLVHGRQEDAHEFLRFLLDSLENCYLLSCKIKHSSIDSYSKETTPFNQVFGGYMRQEVICLKCGHVSTTLQHFMDLQLDISQADHIDTALQEYFRRERIGQEENVYKCSLCKQKVPAIKQFKIERPPLVLCLQLKRFNSLGVKDDRPVTLSKNLSISKYVRFAAAKGIAVEYRIVSVINHVGSSPNRGHYTTMGEAGDKKFYVFDDSTVHQTSLLNVLNSSAYVIFYEILPKTKAAILPSVDCEATSSNPFVLAPGCAADLPTPPKVKCSHKFQI